MRFRCCHQLHICTTLTRVREDCDRATVTELDRAMQIVVGQDDTGTIPVAVRTTQPGQYVMTSRLNGIAIDGDGSQVTFYPGPVSSKALSFCCASTVFLRQVFSCGSAVTGRPGPDPHHEHPERLCGRRAKLLQRQGEL
eukprot:SAG22_NODE_1139_length_5389_cov_1.755577_4_plen_139_part_00